MITTVELTKRYVDGRLALDHVTITVPAGSVYCLFGPGGAGKSTLVNILLRILSPTSGRASVCGIDCSDARAGAQRHLGFIPGQVSVKSRMSALQHMRFFARLSGRERVTTAQLRTALREVCMPERAFGVPLSDYSGFMLQQLAMAIARLKGASALLFEDPVAVFDADGAATIVSLIREMKEEGKAILLVTDDSRWALTVADRVGILKRGVLVQELPGERFAEAYYRNRSLDGVYGDGVFPSSAGPPHLGRQHV